ncbi:MAG: UDP-N-acetylmuramoyl-tripeptide--D-alanyl-D-alanine ligase [Endomicrobium sp.]|jgi:UDP-N-acetylmuramoyl-tripeptide--D-alanyl-D-alanine ligase|nr:UDP-N-acetylmuramoyl-tripeptide--D-alanyl-D-alanine ligase [Endomicrobium sp.]
MEFFYIRELMCAVNGRIVAKNQDLLVNGISIDSKTIKKGEVYFAIRGNRYDGHDFINEAVEKGASVVVCSKDIGNVAKSFRKTCSVIQTDDTIVALGAFAKAYRSKFKNVKVIGITGSNGKTTTKEMLTSILSVRDKTISNDGNFNNRIGLPLSVFCLTSDVRYAIFEMGTSLHGEIEILSDIAKPDVGIITNIGFSHLKTFISPLDVFEEKKILVENLNRNGRVIVNNDDKFLKTLSTANTHAYITFALDTKADVCAKNIIPCADGVCFDLFYKNNCIKIVLPVKGRFNVLNALAAASCAVGFGYSLKEIKEGVENFVPPKMRMETITINGVVLINDAYNANPSSTIQVIQAVLESYPDKEVNLVLGDMLELGDMAADYHFKLGEFICGQNIKSINLFGKMSSNTQKAINGKNVFYSQDSDSLLRNLKTLPVNANSVFLFKASRFMRLEEIYMEFCNILKKRGKW